MGSRKRERYLENLRRRKTQGDLSARIEEDRTVLRECYDSEVLVDPSLTLFKRQVEEKVSSVLSDLDEGDLDIEWEVRHATDDELRAFPAPSLRARSDLYDNLKQTSLWTADFVRPDGTHSICTVNLAASPNDEAMRRIVAATRVLVLEQTGELRPRCPKHIHHALGCKTRVVSTRLSEDSHLNETSVVWICPSDDSLTCEIGAYPQWRAAFENSQKGHGGDRRGFT